MKDLSSAKAAKADLAAFKKAAKAYTARVTRSAAAARTALVEAGIVTKNGRLTKHYR